jgi:glutamate dehydrogenase (NADP+)
LARPEATGYGATYFVEEMLKTKKQSLKGKTVVISGSGNVAQYAVQKVNQLGGKVVALSDSDGSIYDSDGIKGAKWDFIMELKNVKRGRISEYAEKFKCDYRKGKNPWDIKCDVAMPCATQNELDKKDAKKLIDNGCIAVAEGANMPDTIDATNLFIKEGVLFGPGKAANAGGVATSGLEMCQNHIGIFWPFEEVDKQLHQIMVNIHKACVAAATKYGSPGNYVVGANIAGFVKVADSMMDHGLVG